MLSWFRKNKINLSTAPDFLSQQPTEIKKEIISFLPLIDRTRLAGVNRSFHDLVSRLPTGHYIIDRDQNGYVQKKLDSYAEITAILNQTACKKRRIKKIENSIFYSLYLKHQPSTSSSLYEGLKNFSAFALLKHGWGCIPAAFITGILKLVYHEFIIADCLTNEEFDKEMKEIMNILLYSIVHIGAAYLFVEKPFHKKEQEKNQLVKDVTRLPKISPALSFKI